MTTLRRRSARALQTLLSVAAPAFVLAAFALATAQPGVAAAGNRSHARHTAAALPAPSFAATSAPRGARRRKGGTTAHAAPHAHAVAPAAAGRHGRGHQPAPAADRPALWRADRRGRHTDQPVVSRYSSHSFPVHSGRLGQGSAAAAELATNNRRFGNRAFAAAYLRSRARRSAAGARGGRYAETPDTVTSVASTQPARPYASGVAEPDSYNDMAAAVPAGNGASIGTALLMAGPSAGNPAPPSSAANQVVSGFGNEVALSNTDGGTRRRNHPVSATGLPGFAPPLPANLAERNAITLVAVSPAILPDIYDHSGRLVTVAPLKGSHEVLVHQNTMATADGLGRIQDEMELGRLRASRDLIDFPESNSLHMNPQLPYDRRCARAWTVMFAIDIAHDFFERFHQPLYVTSAVRTVSFQMRLQRVNGNAAAIDGDAASPHLTGQALDFGKRGMSAAELAWMRAYLTPLIESGRIDVEEEFQQSCFHISVYRRYAASRGAAQVVAQMQGAPPAVTAQP